METVNTKTTQYEEDEANSDSDKETFTEIKTLESSSNGGETSSTDSSNNAPNTAKSHSHEDATIEEQPASNETVLHYLADTTLHGLNHACLARVKRLRRCLWLLLLLAMTACYLTLAVYSIQRYYKYESTTSFSRRSVDSLDIPAVSVCHTNFVPKSVIAADPELHRLIARLGSEGGLDKLNLTAAQMQSARDTLSKYNFANILISHFWDGIQWCDFNELYCQHRLTWRLSESGLCGTFQHQDTVDAYGDVRTTLPGWVYGLRKCSLSSRYSCSKISSYSYVSTINCSLLATENGQIGLGNGIRMHRFASGKMCVG